MKIGLKTYGELETLMLFKDQVDFFEIMALDTPKEGSLDFLKKIKIPIVIHSQHAGFGINNADITKDNKNKHAITLAINLANVLNSNKIIMHPGELDNSNCTIKNSEDFTKSLGDNRILIENIPSLNKISLCSTPEETLKFLKATGAGFCLDINHAISTALELKIDYIEFLKEFIEIKPAHYHLGGQRLNKDDRAHLCFKDSEINLKQIISLLPLDCEITLEVTTDLEKTKQDLETIKQVITLQKVSKPL